MQIPRGKGWGLGVRWIGRALTKCGPLEKGTADHFSILALRTPWTVWKDKKTWAPLASTCPICYWGRANCFSILALRTPWTIWKGKKIGHWKGTPPRSVGAQYATGDQWRNNSRKNEGLGEFRELVIDREACVLRFLGLQRVRHDWATELNWTLNKLATITRHQCRHSIGRSME